MNEAYVSTRPERKTGLKQRSLTKWHLAPFCEQVQTSVRHLSLTTGSCSVQKELPVPVSWLALMLLWDGSDAPHLNTLNPSTPSPLFFAKEQNKVHVNM